MELTVVIDSSAASAKRDTGEESGDAPLQFDALRLKTIEVFVERLVTGEVKRKELETVGQHLYEGLLTGAVRDFVEPVLGRATAADRLQLRLRLPDSRTPREAAERARAEDLADLPWEYLYCPGIGGGNGFFVSQVTNLVLSRYMPLRDLPDQADVEDETLRIGLVVANPHDDELGPVVAGDVVTAVFELDKRKDVNVKLLDHPTPKRVVQWLKTFRPQVMHFIGHGGFDRGDRAAKIVLIDESGESRDVADDELGSYFVEAGHTPTIVVLHIPEGRSGEIEPNMARAAPALIRAGVPAVVAMQHPFPLAAATHFSSAFYLALADEERIDDAVMLGRVAYLREVPGAYDDRAFGTPVLYARAYSKVLKGPVVATGADESPPTAGPQRAGRRFERQRASRPAAAPGTDLSSTAELAGGTTVSGNGTPTTRSPELDGLQKAVRDAGWKAMTSKGLTGPKAAMVYEWFKTLDDEFAADQPARELAEYILDNWIRSQDDPDLRSVAEAMELIARREAP